MIQANELRIGNLVQAKGPHDTPNTKGIYDIRVIKSDQGIIQDKKVWFTDMWTWCDPIPITPEWLERLGFEKDSIATEIPVGRDSEYKIKIDKKTLLVAWFNPLEIELCHYFSERTTLMDHIKYIHQLQNLFFALTGTELTIKP